MSDIFAGRLKGILDSRNIQQKSIAASLGVSPAVFSAWVKCKSEPSFDMLSLLCRELKVSSDYLIGLSDALSQPSSLGSVLNQTTLRDPLSDLDPDLRNKAEGYLDSLREIQVSRETASQQEA